MRDKTDLETRAQIPIACKLTGAELIGRGEEVGDIFVGATRIDELEDGYAFCYPGDMEWAARLVRFIMTERSCCPFFTFELLFEENEGSIWLRLRGAEGVREFIRDGLIPQHLPSR